MQGFRNHNRRRNDLSELDSARSKLDGVLQNLMEKTDDSPSSSEDEGSKRSPEHVKELSPVASPTKKPTQRIQRKRRRKDDSSAKNSNSCVLKLYDRSVNLAQFSENTSLYPVCRAWIRNEPHGNVAPTANRSPTPTSEVEDEEVKDESKPKNFYRLPPPKEKIKVEFGDSRGPYIPVAIPREEEEFTISSSGDSSAPSRETLLAKHMTRWRMIRQKWKDAAAAKEDRYRESCAILKSMFERSLQREENAVAEGWERLVPT